MINGTKASLDAHIGSLKKHSFTHDLYPHILEAEYRDIPQLWYNGSPFLTFYENTLSAMIYIGERFMVEAMTEAVEHLEFDEELSESDVHGFCDQELNHAEAHNTFNLAIKNNGFDLERAYSESEKLFNKFSKMSLGERLQLTAMMETITSLMSSYILRTFPDSAICPAVKNLYIWHCVEELEHRNSAYYACVKYHGAGFKPSKKNIIYLLQMLAFVYKFAFIHMWKLNHMFKLRNFMDIAKFFLSKNGFGRHVSIGLMRFFFTNGYDPETQFDDKQLNELLAKWEAEYHRDMVINFNE